MYSRLTLCAFLPALLQALQPARAPPARPVSTRARATVMANSLTTISANNLKMTDNIKACGRRVPWIPRAPETPARRREESIQARRGANATARRYVEEKIGGVVEKYAGVSQRCDTHLSVMRNPAVADSDVAEVVVFCKGEVVRAEERSPSMYSSIDLVADKVARKLRKVKERREGKRNKPQLKMSLGEMLEDPVEMEPEVFDATSLIRRKTHAMPAQWPSVRGDLHGRPGPRLLHVHERGDGEDQRHVQAQGGGPRPHRARELRPRGRLGQRDLSGRVRGHRARRRRGDFGQPA